MTILDHRAESAQEELRWREFLHSLSVIHADPAPEPAPHLVCHWVPDPAAPGRMISVWETEPTA